MARTKNREYQQVLSPAYTFSRRWKMGGYIRLSKEDLKNIFKRFYRSDTAHTQRGSYGLGLSIAQNIVLRHHGKIWAESKNGRNTFFVELPVK